MPSSLGVRPSSDSEGSNKRRKLVGNSNGSHSRPIRFSDSDSDNGSILGVTQPQDTIDTLPVSRAVFNGASRADMLDRLRMSPDSSPPPIITVDSLATQPTQILDTPIGKRRADESAVVQVPASSSPIPARSSQATGSKISLAPVKAAFPSALPSGMIPPGAFFRNPMQVAREREVQQTASQSQRRMGELQRISDDEYPAGLFSSDEEGADGESFSRANIKPSVFTNGAQSGKTAASQRGAESQASSANFSQITQKFAYRSEMNGSSSKRPPVRQSGPSRAAPIEVEMRLNDIPDYGHRNKVERMRITLPDVPIRVLYQTLIRKKANVDDALDAILEMGDELAAQPKPAKQRQPIPPSSDDELTMLGTNVRPQPVTAKQNVKTQKSIREKWSTTQHHPLSPEKAPEAPKPRRRLMQGRKNQRKLSPSPPPVDAISVHSDSESDVEVVEVVEAGDAFQTRLLEFFNACELLELCDLSCQPATICETVIASRPFKSVDAVRAVALEHPTAPTKGKGKGGRRRPVGERVVEVCEEMLTAYEAVDELVSRCDSLAQPIATEMKKWGFNVKSGSSGKGELDLVSIDQDGSTTPKDSGIGTPTSSPPPADGSDGDEEGSVRKRGSKPTSDWLLQPKTMAKSLVMKDYQIVGLNWLNLLWSKRLSCILADDMGLGKTCQVISFLTHLAEIGQKGPHMVIVPGSTLENWLREFKNFSPKLTVEPYYGAQKERREQAYAIEEAISTINVIVSTYDCATKKEDGKFLRNLKPVVCVYDEGHMLKNSSTDRYQKLMRIPAKFRLLLTGTPLQNNLQELTSLLAFIMPDMFEDKAEDLAYVFKHKAKTTDSDHGALLSAQRIAKARSMMTPFILRRKKQQVLKHLPDKTTRVEYCEMTESQRELYTKHLQDQREAFEMAAAGKTSPNKTNIMMQLRKAAIHPMLFRRLYTDDMLGQMTEAIMREPAMSESNADYVLEDMQQHSDYECHQLCLKYPNTLSQYEIGGNDNAGKSSTRRVASAKRQQRNITAPSADSWLDSGKVGKLVELLHGFQAAGDRTLVFSQFTSMMDILEHVLSTADPPLPFFRLDGSTPIPTRQDMLDAFASDTSVPVFMLSTKSGGTGINLACANKVVIFDSSFNPHDDVQAENRAHRVGQTREVEVVRLVTRGTVEEQILKLGESKIVLDERVAGEEGGGRGKGKGKEDAGKKAEEEGEAMVEMLLRREIEVKEEDQEAIKEEQKEEAQKKPSADLKDEFLTGLQNAGLDVKLETKG